jgi:hypothetical protein
MGFPLVIVNVFLVFSIAIAVCCWGFALIPIWRANMKTITCIPVLVALSVGAWEYKHGASLFLSLVILSGTFLLANVLLAVVYGWARKSRF